MASPIFPASLPQPSECVIKPHIGYLVSEAEAEPQDFRRVERAPGADIDVVWEFEGSEYATFREFWRVDLLQGHRNFYVQLPSSNDVQWHVANFLQQPQPVQTGYSAWRVTATLEVYERALASIPGLPDEPGTGEPPNDSGLLLLTFDPAAPYVNEYAPFEELTMGGSVESGAIRDIRNDTPSPAGGNYFYSNADHSEAPTGWIMFTPATAWAYTSSTSWRLTFYILGGSRGTVVTVGNSLDVQTLEEPSTDVLRVTFSEVGQFIDLTLPASGWAQVNAGYDATSGTVNASLIVDGETIESYGRAAEVGLSVEFIVIGSAVYPAGMTLDQIDIALEAPIVGELIDGGGPVQLFFDEFSATGPLTLKGWVSDTGQTWDTFDPGWTGAPVLRDDHVTFDPADGVSNGAVVQIDRPSPVGNITLYGNFKLVTATEDTRRLRLRIGPGGTTPITDVYVTVTLTADVAEQLNLEIENETTVVDQAPSDEYDFDITISATVAAAVVSGTTFAIPGDFSAVVAAESLYLAIDGAGAAASVQLYRIDVTDVPA